MTYPLVWPMRCLRCDIKPMMVAEIYESEIPHFYVSECPACGVRIQVDLDESPVNIETLTFMETKRWPS